MKESFCQSEKIYDDQSTTVSVSGIPVLQGVISDVGIKRGTSSIKPLNIKIPLCITLTPITYGGKVIMKREDNERKEKEENQRKIKELREKTKIEEEKDLRK